MIQTRERERREATDSGAKTEGEENNPSVFLSGILLVVTLSLPYSGYFVIFLLLLLPPFVEERCVLGKKNAVVSDGFWHAVPSLFRRRINEWTRRRERPRRRRRRRMRKLRISMSLVDKRRKRRFVWDNDICGCRSNIPFASDCDIKDRYVYVYISVLHLAHRCQANGNSAPRKKNPTLDHWPESIDLHTRLSDCSSRTCHQRGEMIIAWRGESTSVLSKQRSTYRSEIDASFVV